MVSSSKPPAWIGGGAPRRAPGPVGVFLPWPRPIRLVAGRNLRAGQPADIDRQPRQWDQLASGCSWRNRPRRCLRGRGALPPTDLVHPGRDPDDIHLVDLPDRPGGFLASYRDLLAGASAPEIPAVTGMGRCRWVRLTSPS